MSDRGNTVIGFRMPFGKFRGRIITEVPPSYLTWMIVQGHSLAFKAEEELSRRGTPCDFKMDLTAHAIDRASQRAMHLWISTQHDGEGLYSWLLRRAGMASEMVSNKTGSQKIESDGIVFVFEFLSSIPILKTLWLSGSPEP